MEGIEYSVMATPILIIALSYHEFNRGAAYAKGDTEEYNRLTLEVLKIQGELINRLEH